MSAGGRLAAWVLAAALLTLPVSLGAAMVYLDLEPGSTPRDRVVAVLGAPVGGDGVVNEHKPQEGTGRITTEYNKTTAILERIGVQFIQPIDRAALVGALALSGDGDRRMRDGSTLVEWFGAPAHIAFTYAGATDSAGIVSMDYYSPKLFDCRHAVAKGVTPGDLCAGFTETPATSSPSASGPPTSSPPVSSPPVSSPPVSSPPAAPPPAPTGTPAPPPLAPTGSVPPSTRRNPAACYDVYVWADAQEAAAARARQIPRRQMAMDIRLAAQSGDCDKARAAMATYKQRFP